MQLTSSTVPDPIAMDKGRGQPATLRHASSVSASTGSEWLSAWAGPTDHQILVGLLDALGADDSDAAASSLINEFGSVLAVFGGSRHHLSTAVGRGLAETIHASREAMKEKLAERIAARPRLGGSSALMSRLWQEPLFLKQERRIVFYADRAMRLLRTINLAEGPPSDRFIDVARIMNEGLDAGAAAFVLVQNQPSGNPRPGAAGREITTSLVEIGSCLGIEMLDRIIVAGEKVWSYTGFVEPG